MKKKYLRPALAIIVLVILGVLWFWGYRAVNARYEPLIAPDKTVTYEIGQTVPIGPEPENLLKPYGLDGFCYRVNSWQIVDTDTYLQEQRLEDPWQEDGIKPEKLMLVSVTVINDNNGLMDFPLTSLYLKGAQADSTLAVSLCNDLNADVIPYCNLSLPVSCEATITLPFALQRMRFTYHHWKNLEEYPFYFGCHAVNEGWEERIVPLN